LEQGYFIDYTACHRYSTQPRSTNQWGYLLFHENKQRHNSSHYNRKYNLEHTQVLDFRFRRILFLLFHINTKLFLCTPYFHHQRNNHRNQSHIRIGGNGNQTRQMRNLLYSCKNGYRTTGTTDNPQRSRFPGSKSHQNGYQQYSKYTQLRSRAEYGKLQVAQHRAKVCPIQESRSHEDCILLKEFWWACFDFAHDIKFLFKCVLDHINKEAQNRIAKVKIL